MKFSIITPSFRGSNWLKLCIPSVADQEGVELEHIVQDSCSDDGTADWLPHDARVRAFIEKDKGMYDAVNRGYQRASGDLLAYINCDEQYLPGALKTVHDYFETHPEVEVLLADVVVTDSNGDYICHRYSLKPLPGHIYARFPVQTAALFIRRSVIFERQILFDTQWRDLGDFIWVETLLKQGIRFGVLRHFTSVFAETGDNMNWKPNAIREKGLVEDRAPQWTKRWRRWLIYYHRWRMLQSGIYFQKPFDYSLYTAASPSQRVTKHVGKPTGIWKGRTTQQPVK